jgi:UDPglucose 6-dehydrogenase
MFTNISTASYIKYGINTFLATKVMFFNELEALFDGELEDITGAMAFDPRIGTSHMQVPGPDGKKGFGGMCFPKDTKAFALYARNQGKPLEILEKVIEINEKIRKW